MVSNQMQPKVHAKLQKMREEISQRLWRLASHLHLWPNPLFRQNDHEIFAAPCASTTCYYPVFPISKAHQINRIHRIPFLRYWLTS